MKKSRFSVLILLCLLGFVSCNTDMDEVTTLSGNDKGTKMLTLLGDNIEMKKGVLSFESKEDLNALLDKLSTAENNGI